MASTYHHTTCKLLNPQCYGGFNNPDFPPFLIGKNPDGSYPVSIEHIVTKKQQLTIAASLCSLTLRAVVQIPSKKVSLRKFKQTHLVTWTVTQILR